MYVASFPGASKESLGTRLTCTYIASFPGSPHKESLGTKLCAYLSPVGNTHLCWWRTRVEANNGSLYGSV